MKFCCETRDLVDTVTRRQIYLSFKDAMYETFPLFLPRIRDGHERPHRAVDAKESGASRIFDLDDINDFIEECVFRFPYVCPRYAPDLFFFIAISPTDN